MNKKFVIITMQRSGSTMLRTMLDRHPDIRCFGELMKSANQPFYRRFVRFFMAAFYKLNIKIGQRNFSVAPFSKAETINTVSGKNKKLSKILNKVDPKYQDDNIRFSNAYEFIEAVFETEKQCPIKGFKLHIEQHAELVRKLIKNSEYSIILLERENVLAQYSSYLIARATGQFHVKKKEQKQDVKVRFRASSFNKYLERMRSNFAWVKDLLNESGRSYFHVRYTELTDKHKVQQLFEYLGVDMVDKATPITKKWNSSDILSRFTNPNDVNQTLTMIGKIEWVTE